MGGEVAHRGGGADGDRLVDGGAEVSGGATGQFGGGVPGGQGEQQDGAAFAGGGQAVPGRGEVGGRGPQASAGGRLLVGVGRWSVEPRRQHDVGGVEIGLQPRGPLPEQARVTVAGVEQVVQQLTAHPLFGLRRGASGEQQQGGDHRGALQRALVDGV